jgi:hypothetical protein
VPFTWNLSAASPGLPGPFTADSTAQVSLSLHE